MKVKAKVQGQYQGIMFHPGEIFDIQPDDNYPAPWMEVIEAPVEAPKEEAVPAPVPEVEEPAAAAPEVVSEEQKTKKKRWFK